MVLWYWVGRQEEEQEEQEEQEEDGVGRQEEDVAVEFRRAKKWKGSAMAGADVWSSLAIRCAGGWYHSQPVYIGSASGAATADTSGAAPAWEITVWVDGEVAGRYAADPAAVVLSYPPPSLCSTEPSAADSSTRRLSARLPIAASSSAAPAEGDGEPFVPWAGRWLEAAAAHGVGDMAAAEALYLEVAEEAMAAVEPCVAELCLYNVGVMAMQTGDCAPGTAPLPTCGCILRHCRCTAACTILSCM